MYLFLYSTPLDAASRVQCASMYSASDFRKIGRDDAECGADLLPEEGDGGNANHRDQADEQTVFDEGSTLLVPPKAIYQLNQIHLQSVEHHEDPLESWSGDRIQVAFAARFLPVSKSIIGGKSRLKKILATF
jgi:hypothetical protein